jgi:hypothetical protein
MSFPVTGMPVSICTYSCQFQVEKKDITKDWIGAVVEIFSIEDPSTYTSWYTPDQWYKTHHL